MRAPVYILLIISSLVGFQARAQEEANGAAAPDEKAAQIEGCDVFGGVPDVVTGLFPCPLAQGAQPLAAIAAAPEPEAE